MSKVTEALAKIGAKPAEHLPEYSHERWSRQDLKRLLVRKSGKGPKKNPLLAPLQRYTQGMLSRTVNGMAAGIGGSALAVGFDLLLTSRLPTKWRLAANAGSAALALAMPSSSFVAGYGGATLYPLFLAGWQKVTSLR